MKIDLHCHTKYSKDAMSSLDDIFKVLKKKGIDGIAITDHDNINGWNDAREVSKKHNMQVILGEEIKSKNGDILGLFLKKEILMRNEDPEKIINEIHAQNGLAIIPHPFDIKKPFRNIESYLNIIDGIEIFNARRFLDSENDKAKELAEKYPNLIISAGSDSHISSTAGSAYIESYATNLDDFRKNLERKEVKWFGKKTSMIYLLIPTIKKLKNKFFK
ncbi:MAG: PHP domain-containing protein [Candidatus Pacebacteria bacterium]|nr:PHP domain-containing protein [Candidatus Paceibacterota bacterium]